MLAIIIVSWNTRDLLDRCITAVHASLAGSAIVYRIIVVDNASTDGTPAMLRERHPETLLLEAGRNLGFAGGNNLALRRIFTNPAFAGYDYIFLLNPDTEAVGDAIPTLIGYLAEHPETVVVGPRLRYADGALQPSRRRFPSRGVFLLESTPLEQRWPNNSWARRYRYADTPEDAEQQVDWLVGAALLARRATVERAGLLDAGFTMYSEELEWQQRLKRFGRIVYLPAAEIIHHEGKSSEQAPARRYINFHQSRLRYAQMRYGARFARLLRACIVALYSIELTVEAGKWLLGHRRDLRAQRVAAYAALVLSLRDGREF